MLASVCSLDCVPDGSNSAHTASYRSSPRLTAVARVPFHMKAIPMRPRTDLVPSHASGSPETSQQGDVEPQLRKSCDYCVRMKRGCDGGTPCELCNRRNKLCIRSVKKRSGPAKGTKYCKRRARKKPSSTTTSDELADTKPTPAQKSPSGGQSVSGDANDDDDTNRDDRTKTKAFNPSTEPGASTVKRSAGQPVVDNGAVGLAGASVKSAYVVPIKSETALDKHVDLAPAAVGEPSQVRWQDSNVGPDVGHSSLLPLYVPEEPVDETFRALSARSVIGESPASLSTTRIIGTRRSSSLEQALYGSAGKRSSFSALIGSVDVDIDRKDRKDVMGVFWNRRYFGENRTQDGVCSPAGLSNGEVPAVPTSFSGSCFRTAGMSFVKPQGAVVGVPSAVTAPPCDISCEPSLRDLLLEKWPPAPLNELAMTETK